MGAIDPIYPKRFQLFSDPTASMVYAVRCLSMASCGAYQTQSEPQFELGRRELLDREVLSAGPRLPEVIGHLHTKPRFRTRPERFREAEGHFD